MEPRVKFCFLRKFRLHNHILQIATKKHLSKPSSVVGLFYYEGSNQIWLEVSLISWGLEVSTAALCPENEVCK